MTVSEREQEVLDFWDRERVFERSVQERPADKPYVFFDGPPFATGLPHYGHLPSTFMKDAIPRYQTMRGYRVERVWGWDCHGLPIENIIEERLGLSSKRAIEQYGVEKFCEECRSAVLTYAEEWKKIIKRLGRWVDMAHSYKTMDRSYMESVWWVFSQLWEKGLIYEGKKAMHICPRCVTPLSNFEVTQGYKEVTDISVTAKFKLKNAKEKLGINDDVFMLAWTTTPWTLPGNMLLAVGPEIKYGIFRQKESGEHFILALDRWAAYAQKVDADNYEQIGHSLKGNILDGLTYEPLFPYFASTANAFRVVTADFVTTEDGTGVVHIAPAFGQDDYQLGLLEQVGFVQHVSMDGKFTSDVTDCAGQDVKPKDDPTKADVAILKLLSVWGRLFHKEKYTHSYPHCWRCDTPLLNYATSSWFVAVTKIKKELLANNAKTHWVPEHIRDGRFGKWLENARDWAISRDRYWGTPLPVWKSEDGETLVISSVAELEALTGQSILDLHKHVVDEVQITKNGKVYRHIPQVLDCWFESGSMPYGQMHYPFESKDHFEKGFPAQCIAEGQDQTRGWFYTLHVLATALTYGENPSIPVKESTPAFLHCIVNGIVLAEDGKKMSKRLKNYPDLMGVVERYGADAVRFYILSSPVVRAENLNFSESGVREVANKFVNTLWNVALFSTLESAHDESGDDKDNPMGAIQSTHPLDRWILSRLARLTIEVTDHMERYSLSFAARPLQEFVTDLSQWYVRRSRDRMKSDDSGKREEVRSTLNTVLLTCLKLTAPFTPFLAETIHQMLPPSGRTEISVHLEAWPSADVSAIDEVLEQDMSRVRAIVEMGHALRASAGIKVRQPLAQCAANLSFSPKLAALIAEELNVKRYDVVARETSQSSGSIFKEDGDLRVSIDTQITAELEQEGILREIIRQINAKRKNMGLIPKDRVRIHYASADPLIRATLDRYCKEAMASVLAQAFDCVEGLEGLTHLDIDGHDFYFSVEVV